MKARLELIKIKSVKFLKPHLKYNLYIDKIELTIERI